MYCNITLFLVAVIMVVALADEQSGTTMLTGKVGKSLCLITGLRGFSQVTLSSGPDHRVLLNFYNGTLVRNKSERFQLDVKNGSVIISPLNFNDSGMYDLRIIDGNNLVNKHTYEINVTKPDPTQLPAGLDSNNVTADQKNRLAVGLSVGLIVAAVGTVIVCAVRHRKIGGNSACRGNCGDNSVV